MLERVRKSTTFLLAVFLWLHAFFFLPIQPTIVAKIARVLRLAPSEIVLFALLVIFSFLAASGFWRTVGSIAYIYGFPFVVLGYMLWLGFRLIRATNRWLISQAPSPPIVRPLILTPIQAPIVPNPTQTAVVTPDTAETNAGIKRFLFRPFRRFMFLWCILLLATTHQTVVWLCLIIVIAQLARQILIILRLVFSPKIEEVLNRIGPAVVVQINNALVALRNITRDVAPSNELRNLFNQLNLWRTLLDFLRNPYLLSRWMWILVSVFLAAVYVYTSFLFSFAYYGIARVSGVSFSWPQAFVTSIFFPLYFADLPRVLVIKVVGGIHGLLLLGVSIGTIKSFFSRKMDEIRKAATEANNSFAEQTIQEKYTILQELFTASPTAASPQKSANEVVPPNP